MGISLCCASGVGYIPNQAGRSCQAFLTGLIYGSFYLIGPELKMPAFILRQGFFCVKN